MASRLAVAFAIAALTAVAPAQMVGEPAPDIQWQSTFNFGSMKKQKLSELRGSAVLVEFWATWCGPCRAQIPHLNGLHERLASRGLVVVGVSNEEAALVEPFVAKMGMKYPVAVAEERYGVNGIPAAFLLDPGGKVVWAGHPAALEESTIEQALVGARPAMLAAGLEEVGRLTEQGQFGNAYAKVKDLLAGGKLGAEAQEQARAIATDHEQKVATALDQAKAAIDKGDVYAAFALLDPIAKNYQGVPRADEAAQKTAAMLADARQKREIQGGQKFAEAQALEQQREFDNAFKAYKAVANAWNGTKAAKDATAAAAAIEKGGKLGYLKGCGACEAAGRACPAHKKKK